MTDIKLVHVIEDDDAMREAIVAVLEGAGYEVRAHAGADAFLRHDSPGTTGCVVSDYRLPGMDGMQLLAHLKSNSGLPLVLITAHADIRLAVAAIKAGAVDFIEKPFDARSLIDGVEAALQEKPLAIRKDKAKEGAALKLGALTARETDVLRCLVAGLSNKMIAIKLGLSPRTVEHHRAHIMEKMGVRGLPQLVQLWMLAGNEV